jgi:protein-S-isoprenylcysteine O-methyltransferase Ste14
MSPPQSPQGSLIRLVLRRFLTTFVLLPVFFFLPAGTIAYWEAWVYLGILLVSASFVLTHLFRRDPELLARRMRTKEKHADQRLIIKLAVVPLVLAFLLPGFDRRFGWSDVPVALVLAADALVLLGYFIVFLVFTWNPYASRVVEVEPGQTVVRSGPYAVVRHPMYVGALLMYVLSPLALGSYWALIPAALNVPVFVARILTEERVLARDLDGYRDYMQATRYRLIPGIW